MITRAKIEKIKTIQITIFSGAELTNCPKHQVTFEKIIGIRPTDVNAGVLLYEDKHGRPVALNCIEKCSENKDCLHFVLEYNTSRCYRFKHNVQEMSEVVVVDTDASWFVKTCLARKYGTLKCMAINFGTLQTRTATSRGCSRGSPGRSWWEATPRHCRLSRRGCNANRLASRKHLSIVNLQSSERRRTMMRYWDGAF